jgi:hypothetical protein
VTVLEYKISADGNIYTKGTFLFNPVVPDYVKILKKISLLLRPLLTFIARS